MIALAAVALWAAYGAIGPAVFAGESSQHNALFVRMAATGRNGNDLASVRVQERGEWRLCKIVGVLCALPGLMLAPDQVSQMILTLLPMLLCDALFRSAPALDLAGHGAEIIEAERRGIIGYRQAEIERMRLFDGRKSMTINQLDAALRRWHWLARIVWALGKF